MKLEIIKVESKDCEEIQVRHIYPKGNSQIFHYRRYAHNHWCCDLGCHGWHRYLEPEMLEEAYDRWKRKTKEFNV